MPSQEKDLRQAAVTDPAFREMEVRFLGPRANRSPASADRDCVATEGPLELRLHGKPAAVLLRTPGHDEELALGFLFHEGIITRRDEVLDLERPDDDDSRAGTALSIKLTSSSRGKSIERFFYSTSSCGACGKNSLESLEVRGTGPKGHFTVPASLLARMVETMRAEQALFATTGGTHGCGLFDIHGNMLALREDVGRHNALDKLTGYGLNQGWLPFSDRVLVLSGRVGYEMVQKAVVSGIPMIVAVGAPTSLAVDIALRFGITLVGFLRGASMNVYAHPERLA